MTLSLLLLIGCKHSRVMTDYLSDNQAASLESKGRQLLEASVEAMGYDQLLAMKSYQADALFDWRFPWGMIPMNALRGSKNKKTSFRFIPNSFDGQMRHLEGRKEGFVFGLQSWQYYEEVDGEFERDSNSRREWALATYHYLIEGPLRLLNADIV